MVNVELGMTEPSISDHKFEAMFVLKWVKMFSFNNFGTWKFSFIKRVQIVLLSLIDLYNLICHTKDALYWIKLVNYFFNSPCGTFALASKMVSYNVLIIELATEGKNSIPKLYGDIHKSFRWERGQYSPEISDA